MEKSQESALNEALKAFQELRPPETQDAPNKAISTDPFEIAKLYARGRALLSLGYGERAHRGDKEFVRHLAESPNRDAIPILKAWQTHPTFQFSNGEHTMDLWDCEINLPSGMTRAEFGAQAIANAFSNLPFKFLNFSIYDVLSGFMIYTVVTAEEDGALINFISWTRGKNTQWHPRGMVSRRGEDDKYYHSPVKIDGVTIPFDDISKFIADSVACCCCYMQQTSKHAVEVSAKAPKVTADSKTGKKKPWLRDDKSHIIYVDPYRARQHGHSAVSLGAGPARRAHARRGHWRRYKVSEKRAEELLVFVRPAWVGPGEWEHQGKVYKVIRDKKVESE